MNNLSIKSLTFFFSDIENSTYLAQRLKEKYFLILDRHRTVIRKAISQYGGKEVDTAGDGFFVVFDRADQAAMAAISIQQVFALEDWAIDIGLKVRVGIHTGEALTTGTDYTGLEVHRASRICNSAHGGQVILSEPAFDQLPDVLSTENNILPLGTFNLKGFDEPAKLYQLIVPGHQYQYPAIRTDTSRQKLAVMPFSNLSTNAEEEYLCDGITEEIILALSRIKGFQVAARSSSFAFKNKSVDARELGKHLGVNAILEGAVRKTGDQIRISVTLVDAQSGLNIWSERYDRKLENVFALQDEIAGKIAAAMEVKLVPEQTRSIQERQTNNVAAYDFYIKGRRLYSQYTIQGVQKAKEMFKKAVEIDPAYALAYCGLSDSYVFNYMYLNSSDELLSKAEYASSKALELAPLLAKAYVSRGLVYSVKKEYKLAEEAFENAIQYNPSLFEAWYQYGRACFMDGKYEKAARLFEEASRVRPEDYQSLLLAAQVFDDLGLKELAKLSYQRGMEIIEQNLAINPEDTRALYFGANTLVVLGDKENGLRWIEKALENNPDDPMVMYNAGCVYSLLGMPDKAIHYLKQSIHGGLSQLDWFANDSNLDPLRELPAFQKILHDVRENEVH